MSSPIEDYALLGDGETAALLSLDGSIDWLCWPRFDDAACFAALLGTPENGCWAIAPRQPVNRRTRRYQDDTLIMETDFETADGAVRLIDFMPIRKGASALIRIVAGLRGIVPMRCSLRLRFDYGALPPWSETSDREMVAKAGPDLAVLRSPVDLTGHAHATFADFDLQAGDRRAFVLSYGASHEKPPVPVDAEAALADTQSFWRGWIGGFDNTKTKWPKQVRRSLITLKAMIHAPTGGLVAAAFLPGHARAPGRTPGAAVPRERWNRYSAHRTRILPKNKESSPRQGRAEEACKESVAGQTVAPAEYTGQAKRDRFPLGSRKITVRTYSATFVWKQKGFVSKPQERPRKRPNIRK